MPGISGAPRSVVKANPPLWSACRFCGGCAAAFARWTLWLLLGALLALQLYLLTVRQLAVPPFLLRELESRLAASHLAVRFDHATFDPSGRIFAENVRLKSSSFSDPLVTARALYVRLDPWALLAGHFDPREVRVVDANFFVPAPLSLSGRPEALVSDCAVDLIPHNRGVEVAQFNCRAGEAVVTAHGLCRLPAGANTAATGILPLADLFGENYPRLSRQLAGFIQKLGRLKDARLRVELAPSDRHGAMATATLDTRAFSREGRWAMQASGLRAVATGPLLDNAGAFVSLDLSTAELILPGRGRAKNLRLHLSGRARVGQLGFVPRFVGIAADELEGFSLRASDFSAQCAPETLSRVRPAAVLRLAGAPVALEANLDLKNKNGWVQFDAGLAPALLAPLGAWLHSDLPGLLQLHSPIELQGNAEFSGGWRFSRLSTRLEARRLVAQSVPLDFVSGRIDLHDHDLRVTDIVLRQHDNLALGSYTMDTATRDYRFLLHGRMRPLEDAAWFAPSWSVFWKKFDFSAAPVGADVDVRGRWGAPELTDVFVFADVASPVVRGVPLDRVRALLRWQPARYDCREFFIAQGARTARGSFIRSIDLAKDTWRDMEFDGTSNLDPSAAAQIIAGQEGVDFVAPFKFAQPPTLHVAGRLESPAAPGGEHEQVQITVASTGDFSLYDFPLGDVSFDAVLRDDDIDLPRISASFAGGTLNGRAFLSGAEAERRLRFDFHLINASLGRAVTTVDEFVARRKKQPPDPPTQFVQHAADIRLDLTAAAAGLYHDPLSFTGNGHAAIAGPELGQIRLLGVLSQLPPLGFASLRFTAAQASFNLEKTKIAFPQVKVTGANSAIEAKGDYFLDKKTLDFNATVSPFEESKFALANIVTTPFSKALEVRLTGTLAKPSWAFVIGPTNILRELSQPKPGVSKDEKPPIKKSGD